MDRKPQLKSKFVLWVGQWVGHAHTRSGGDPYEASKEIMDRRPDMKERFIRWISEEVRRASQPRYSLPLTEYDVAFVNKYLSGDDQQALQKVMNGR